MTYDWKKEAINNGLFHSFLFPGEWHVAVYSGVEESKTVVTVFKNDQIEEIIEIDEADQELLNYVNDLLQQPT